MSMVLYSGRYQANKSSKYQYVSRKQIVLTNYQEITLECTWSVLMATLLHVVVGFMGRVSDIVAEKQIVTLEAKGSKCI